MSQNPSNISKLAQDIGQSLSEELTVQLRFLGVTSGWPMSVLGGMRVSVDNQGSLNIVYPESLAEEIENLEYGTLNTLPNAVIRPFMLRAGDTIASTIESMALVPLLEDAGIIS